MPSQLLLLIQSQTTVASRLLAGLMMLAFLHGDWQLRDSKGKRETIRLGQKLRFRYPSSKAR